MSVCRVSLSDFSLSLHVLQVFFLSATYWFILCPQCICKLLCTFVCRLYLFLYVCVTASRSVCLTSDIVKFSSSVSHISPLSAHSLWESPVCISVCTYTSSHLSVNFSLLAYLSGESAAPSFLKKILSHHLGGDLSYTKYF
jgi:hypothetical protein